MLRSLPLLAICLGVLITTLPIQAAEAEQMLVYIGNRTKGDDDGIYIYRLDMASGRLSQVGKCGDVEGPSFLALHPTGRFLYSVCSLEGEGGVAALAIDESTGLLKLLNTRSSGGPGPCHVAVDRAGRNLLVANYQGGSVGCLPITGDGKLSEMSSFIQHEGSGADERRQAGPHAHSINVDPDNRFAMAADLGTDDVFVYRLDADIGMLAPNDPPSAEVAPGSGPRHFAFHPNGKLAYVINEMANTITAFRYDAQRGVLTTIETVGTLPKDFSGDNTTAEVQVHPSGNFLYGSNRGHDSIAVLAIDQSSGKLTPVEHESTQGQTPRNFGIDPTGTWLLAANQGSGNVVVFRIDQQTGALEPSGNSIEVPAPMCVKFLAR